MKRLVIALVAACGCSMAHAADTLVEEYFGQLRSLTAEFVQTVFDADAELMEASRGTMYMQRPGRFRWDYREPYEQLVVSDGERLWLYDVDLEQISVRKLDDALTQAPLAVLSGAAPIEDAFVVSEPIEHAGLLWFELLPKEEETEFNTLWVSFNEDRRLNSLELVDQLGQRTRLSFSDPVRNSAIDSELFRFQPPAGVDVVGDMP